MAFIQAPSYKPPQQYDMWGGIADIFGDITSMRESKRQRERQRIADAQSAASHASLQRNRQQIYDLKAAEAERLAKIEADFAAYTGSEQQQLDKLAVEGYVPRTGKYLGFRGDGPGASINTMTTPTLRDRSDAELRFATQSRQKHLQNLGYIETRLKTIESRAQAAIAAGNADKLAKLKQEGQTLLNAKREVEARLAEDTEKDKRAYTGSQADNAASIAAINEGKAERNRKLSEIRNTLSGRGELPVQTQVGPESFQTSRQPIKPGSRLYNQAISDWQIFDSPTAAQVKAVKDRAGLADIASGKVSFSYDPANQATHTQNIKKLNTPLDAFMKQHVDEINAAAGEGNTPPVTESEYKSIIQSLTNAAIRISSQTGENADIVLDRLMRNPSSYAVVQKNLNDPYHDYIPMKTQNIITKYLRESNQNAGRSGSDQGQTTNRRLTRDERKAQLEQQGIPKAEAIATMKREGYFD